MLRRVGPDDAGQFDKLIQSSPEPDFAQTAVWAKLKSVSWRPVHYSYDQGGGPVIAVTVWLRKPPLLPWSLGYAPRGPVLLVDDAAQYLPHFLEQLREEMRRQGVFALKIDPAWTSKQRAKTLEEIGFERVVSDHPFGGTQPRLTFRLDISADEEELLATMPKKTRYSIRYPEKNGVDFRLGTKEDIPLLMEALRDTSRRKKFLERGPEYYERLLDSMGDQASLMLALHEGQVVAAGVTVVTGKIGWAVYGGMVREFANLRGYYGLNWRRMLWAKSRGAEVFDFFGVPVDYSEESPLHGLYQFKKSFGGELIEFVGEYELPIRRFPFWLWRNFSPWALKLWRRFSAFLRGRKHKETTEEDSEK